MQPSAARRSRRLGGQIPAIMEAKRQATAHGQARSRSSRRARRSRVVWLAGASSGTETFPAKMTLEVAGLKLKVEFAGDIALQ